MRGEEEIYYVCKMNFYLVVLFCCILLCGVVMIICELNDGKCVSFVNGLFDICIKVGYNNIFFFFKKLMVEL